MQAVGRHDVVARRQVAAVDDEQDVRGRGALVGAEARPVAEVGREQVAEVVERRRDQAHRADRVGLAGALRVREPLHPVPVGEVRPPSSARRRSAGRGSGRPWPSRSSPARSSGPRRPRRTARCGRRRAGRSRPAGGAGSGARRAGGGGRRRLPGRPGRRARSPAAPARATAAASTGRSARAGSCRRVPVCSHSRVRSSASDGSADGSGWCQLSARRCWSAASRATLRMLPR